MKDKKRALILLIGILLLFILLIGAILFSRYIVNNEFQYEPTYSPMSAEELQLLSPKEKATYGAEMFYAQQTAKAQP